MNPNWTHDPPQLPLLLWETPPGLELLLAQEGVPFLRIRDAHRLAFGQGRFVLHDSRRITAQRLRATLGPEHVPIDIDSLRPRGERDPFKEVLATDSVTTSWNIEGTNLTERVARVDRAAIRSQIMNALRPKILEAGGIWARLAAYPYPYRSAFNFRVDLDEPNPDDYERFAQARTPLNDCTTHFISTAAYGGFEAILKDVGRFDAQSHGHFHTVYRGVKSNLRNLANAHRLLESSQIIAEGFAAPGGRWNHALDHALEAMLYRYSSDFQVGYDDRPFFPWVGDRFSSVLQVPVHPICEGLFLEAGAANPRRISNHFRSVLQSKVAAGEPAFLYGHPEQRLGRWPEILKNLASAIAGQDLLWRTTMTAFARWWVWRAQRRWSIVGKGPGLIEVQLDHWDSAYPLGLEIQRGEHIARIPITSPRQSIRLDHLAFERRGPRIDPPAATPFRRPWGLRQTVREAIDWETVTPVAELPTESLRDLIKKGLRHWRERGGPHGR